MLSYVTFNEALQLENTPYPYDVTDAGIVIDSNEMHCWNAALPIVFKLGGSVILLNLMQELKQSDSIVCNEFGNITSSTSDERND